MKINKLIIQNLEQQAKTLAAVEYLIQELWDEYQTLNHLHQEANRLKDRFFKKIEKKQQKNEKIIENSPCQ